MAAATTYRWGLGDLAAIPPNGRKVFTTFSCGGGSSMGYKLAGFDVVAANDIDPVMARHYRANLHPKHYFECPVSKLATMDLPDELIGIDLLDGSPPCSTFSLAGVREEGWGVEKLFREGQAVQVLSDLFFDFLTVVGRVKPKMIVAENVKGMILGAARGYTKLVMTGLDRLGYRAQLFLVNAADCGVPQRRERVFFVAMRKDIEAPPLKLSPSSKWVSAMEAIGDIEVTGGRTFKVEGLADSNWRKTMPGESFSENIRKVSGRQGQAFMHIRMDPSRPSSTLTAAPMIYHWREPRFLDLEEVIRIGSFPRDYAFESPHIGMYMIGMSVPPLMTKAVADAITEQWVPLLP